MGIHKNGQLRIVRMAQDPLRQVERKLYGPGFLIGTLFGGSTSAIILCLTMALMVVANSVGSSVDHKLAAALIHTAITLAFLFSFPLEAVMAAWAMRSLRARHSFVILRRIIGDAARGCLRVDFFTPQILRHDRYGSVAEIFFSTFALALFIATLWVSIETVALFEKWYGSLA